MEEVIIKGAYNFERDIVEGKNGELRLIKFLEKSGNVLVSTNDTNTHDFIMMTPSTKTFSYEIKTDFYVTPDEDTRNIFIEYECRNNPSGIVVTTADWFVYHFKHLNEAWFIKTDKLRKLIDKYPFFTTYKSGDPRSNTKGYLIPRFAKEVFGEFKIYNLEDERI
jgi:hypothetical protein